MLLFLLQAKEIVPAPESWCWRLIPEIAETHRAANLLTFGAYALLGATLFALFLRLVFLSPARIVSVLYLTIINNARLVVLFLFCFGLFILLCGATHYLDYYVIDNVRLFGKNAFRVGGQIKMANGVVSAITALSFLPLAAQMIGYAKKSKSRRGIGEEVFNDPSTHLADEVTARLEEISFRLQSRKQNA